MSKPPARYHAESACVAQWHILVHTEVVDKTTDLISLSVYSSLFMQRGIYNIYTIICQFHVYVIQIVHK